MLKNKLFQTANNLRGNPTIPGKPNWLQPKLTFTLGCFYMNMNWLIAFIRIKMEPKRT